MQNADADSFYQDIENDLAWAESIPEESEGGLSLPTILLNAALGIAVIGSLFYVAYFALAGTLLTSAVIAGLGSLVLFTPLGILCARLTGAPVVSGNLLWGCGLTMMMFLAFGLCALTGAVAALLVEAAQLAVR